MTRKKLPPHLRKVVKALDSGRRFNSKTGKPGRKLTNKELRGVAKLVGADKFKDSSGKIRKLRK